MVSTVASTQTTCTAGRRVRSDEAAKPLPSASGWASSARRSTLAAIQQPPAQRAGVSTAPPLRGDTHLRVRRRGRDMAYAMSESIAL